MNVITAIGLFSAGYIYGDYKRNGPRSYPYHSPYGTGRHPYTIKDYLKEVAMDKMDILFYGNKKFNKGSEVINRDILEHTFSTRFEAEEKLLELNDVLDKYEKVTLNDYADILELPRTARYAYSGWTDLSSADVVRNRKGGYVIKFPPLEDAIYSKQREDKYYD